MTALNEAVAVPMGIPTGGMDLNQPLASMSPSNSPWLLNVDCENQALAVRPGVKIHATLGSAGNKVKQLGVYGVTSGESMFAYFNDGSSTHKIYNVSTTTPSLAHTLVDNDAPDVYLAKFSRLLAFITSTDSADCAVTYNGSAWSAWNFTYSAAAVCGYVVCQYRSRVYVLLGSNLYYSSVSAVSGALSILQLADVMDVADEFIWAAPLPVSQQNINDVYLAFGCSQGEVFIYGGSYPGSSTWGIVQKFKIDPGVGYNLSAFSYKNDVWLLTSTGIVSLRNILTSGVEAAYESSPSFPINDYWTKLASNLGLSVWDGNETQFSIVHWPEKNRILVMAAGHIDEDGTYSADATTMFSYNTLTKAWSIYKISTLLNTSVGGLTYFAGDIYFYTGNVIMKLDDSIFKDETYNSAATYTGFSYVIDGAYSDLGTSGKRKRIVGFSPILKTDFDGSKVTMKAAADIGRMESGAAAVMLQDGYNAPEYSVGAEGARVKYRIEGTTDTASTDGLKLYAMDAKVKPKESTR